MKSNKVKNININILQAEASKVIKDVEAGKVYKIMRYSNPVAVLISQDEYECLTGECRGCVKELVKKLNK